jgi:CheY-like chemotaxis protein
MNAPIAARPGATGSMTIDGVPTQLRILVVDNDPSISRIIERILGEKHQLRTCTDAREAHDLLLYGSGYDVVLCDLLMPGVSGQEFYAKVVSIDPVAAARIVFITGAATLPDAQTFLASIPNVVLEKPFTRAALRDTVFDVASRHASKSKVRSRCTL